MRPECRRSLRLTTLTYLNTPDMPKLILASILALVAFAAPAEAHNRHRHHKHQRQATVFISPWAFGWQVHRPRVRINQNCVWKPWNNRTVCRY